VLGRPGHRVVRVLGIRVMKCEARFGPSENLGKWQCGVCGNGFGSNCIECKREG